MLTVGNKAVVSPNSGSSQESSRTGKTKRSQSSQVCGNLRTRQSKQIISCMRQLAAQWDDLSHIHFSLIIC